PGRRTGRPPRRRQQPCRAPARQPAPHRRRLHRHPSLPVVHARDGAAHGDDRSGFQDPITRRRLFPVQGSCAAGHHPSKVTGVTLSVLVTTFGRRQYLGRWVRSILGQERLPAELVLVTRKHDADSEAFVRQLIDTYPGPVRVRHATVERPGVLAANIAGFSLVTGEIFSFIDDDASAPPDWLRRIEAHFRADPTLGAVGGRDIRPRRAGGAGGGARVVGRITWYGRIGGNPPKISEGVRHVHHLRGVNMSFRRAMIESFDERILGNAHYYELDLCLGVLDRGFRILYDGSLTVDHDLDAPRYLPGSQAGGEIDRAYFVHHNRVYVMMKHLPLGRRLIFLMYTFVRDGL